MRARLYVERYANNLLPDDIKEARSNIDEGKKELASLKSLITQPARLDQLAEAVDRSSASPARWMRSSRRSTRGSPCARTSTRSARR